MLRVRCRIWIERDGSPVFGDGRARLLKAIAESHSLSAAARRLRIPYRTAWKHLNLMERAYGTKIVDRTTGGPTGGGCRLTKAGSDLLGAYERFRGGLDDLLSRRFRRLIHHD